MIGAAAQPQFLRLIIGARAFGLVILCGPVVVTGDNTSILALLAVGVIWTAATAADRLRLSRAVVIPAEAALIGAACALSLETSLAVLGALAVPPFTAALQRGPLGVAIALSAELATVVLVHALISGVMTAEQGAGIFTWIVTGTGLGLIGSFLYSTTPVTRDPLAPYREARRLLRGLVELSGGLRAGLDPVALGASIAEVVRDELPVTSVVIYVPRDDALTPLLSLPEPDTETLAARTIAARAAESGGPVLDGRAFAVALTTEPGLVAVAVGTLPLSVDPQELDLTDRLERLRVRLRAHALQLDTALLFAALRDSATADERRRLAREIHDGVAQDIASLGYQVDALVARPSSPEQAAQLQLLRNRITHVVAEVRRSVQTLRSEASASASLGTAIGSVARHLSDSSGIPIRVTVDERTGRLRPEVESELFRIAQEAMTNAVRHARPERIRIRCVVQAPSAEIVVTDDGTGMGPKRADSHGLDIMRERARLIDAELTIEDACPHGTVVTVRLPSTRVVPPAEGVSGDMVST